MKLFSSILLHSSAIHKSVAGQLFQVYCRIGDLVKHEVLNQRSTPFMYSNMLLCLCIHMIMTLSIDGCLQVAMKKWEEFSIQGCLTIVMPSVPSQAVPSCAECSFSFPVYWVAQRDCRWWLSMVINNSSLYRYWTNTQKVYVNFY